MLKYKNYIGQFSYDDEAQLFHGYVINLTDIITFQGTTVKELENAFRNSIEDYLAWCMQTKNNKK